MDFNLAQRVVLRHVGKDGSVDAATFVLGRNDAGEIDSITLTEADEMTAAPSEPPAAAADQQGNAGRAPVYSA